MGRGEVFVSFDIECDGPYPAHNSMLSLGAVAFSRKGEEVGVFYDTLKPYPGASPDPSTMEWWAKQDPEVQAEAFSARTEPSEVMIKFALWLKNLPGVPVFLAWPTGYDFSFLYFYSALLPGHQPLGYQALDVRSFCTGLYASSFWAATDLIPEEYTQLLPEERAHHPVTDSKQQGRAFIRLLADAEEAAVKCAMLGV